MHGVEELTIVLSILGTTKAKGAFAECGGALRRRFVLTSRQFCARGLTSYAPYGGAPLVEEPGNSKEAGNVRGGELPHALVAENWVSHKPELRVDPSAKGDAIQENTRGLVTGAFPVYYRLARATTMRLGLKN